MRKIWTAIKGYCFNILVHWSKILIFPVFLILLPPITENMATTLLIVPQWENALPSQKKIVVAVVYTFSYLCRASLYDCAVSRSLLVVERGFWDMILLNPWRLAVNSWRAWSLASCFFQGRYEAELASTRAALDEANNKVAVVRRCTVNMYVYIHISMLVLHARSQKWEGERSEDWHAFFKFEIIF